MSSDPASAEVLVAGGGIIGLSIAWRLAQRGCAVTICEAGRIGGEASWAAAGMLAPGGEFSGPSPEATLALDSRKLYREFVRELEHASGSSIDYTECGGLELAFSAQQLAELEDKAAQQVELGIASKAVPLKRAAAFWPRLDTTSLSGVRFYPEDAVVDPRTLTQALATACQRAGVAIVQDCGVKSIEVEREHVTVTCAQESRSYRAAVVAAGAWSSSIAVRRVPPLPLCEPVKGQMIAYQQPAQTCNTIIREGHQYMLQRANGMLIVGASMERAGFDRSLSEDVSRNLAEWAGTVLPHLAETEPVQSWVGFRPAADALQLGPWHSQRLLLAYGHFRNGVLLAPITAQKIAAALLG